VLVAQEQREGRVLHALQGARVALGQTLFSFVETLEEPELVAGLAPQDREGAAGEPTAGALERQGRLAGVVERLGEARAEAVALVREVLEQRLDVFDSARAGRATVRETAGDVGVDERARMPRAGPIARLYG
jgi:hypothetical protein